MEDRGGRWEVEDRMTEGYPKTWWPVGIKYRESRWEVG